MYYVLRFYLNCYFKGFQYVLLFLHLKVIDGRADFNVATNTRGKHKWGSKHVKIRLLDDSTTAIGQNQL